MLGPVTILSQVDQVVRATGYSEIAYVVFKLLKLMFISGHTIHLLEPPVSWILPPESKITFVRNPVNMQKEEVEILFYLILSHKRLDDVI